MSSRTSHSQASSTAKNRRFKAKGLTIGISQERLSANQYIEIALFEGSIDERNNDDFNRKAHNGLFMWDCDLIWGFHNLERIGSVGIAVLFSVFYKQKEHGKRLAIGGVHPCLEPAFRFVNFPSEIDIFESLELAKLAFLEKGIEL